MNQQFDVEPLSFQLKDDANENDRFYTNFHNGAQDPLSNDFQRDNLLHRSKLCFDQNKTDRQDMNNFLDSKNDNYDDKTNNTKRIHIIFCMT
jgi:hypothetical protein